MALSYIKSGATAWHLALCSLTEDCVVTELALLNQAQDLSRIFGGSSNSGGSKRSRGLRFRAQSLGLGFEDLGFRDLRLRASGFGCWMFLGI